MKKTATQINHEFDTKQAARQQAARHLLIENLLNSIYEDLTYECSVTSERGIELSIECWTVKNWLETLSSANTETYAFIAALPNCLQDIYEKTINPNMNIRHLRETRGRTDINSIFPGRRIANMLHARLLEKLLIRNRL